MTNCNKAGTTFVQVCSCVNYPLEERLSIVVISTIVKHLCSIAQQFHIIT